MYWRILKKDLKRKKTMNMIMLIFIILASMFMASSANNMSTVSSAMDDYFDMAEVPDYWYSTYYRNEAKRFEDFARTNGYQLKTAELIQIDPGTVTVNEKRFKYSNTVTLSTVQNTKVFDENEKEITHISDGEIYITNEIFRSANNNFYNGCKIQIDTGTAKKEFTLKGYTKDVLFGSSMIGVTRFLVSENDYHLFNTPDRTIFYSLAVFTDDEAYKDKFDKIDLMTIMNVDRPTIKLMYIMDTLIAAIILVVSVCLILISMVILRFTIHFTISQEFREIGVMKAIGITSRKIRALYVIKYFATATVGAATGLMLSIPFGQLLLDGVAENIIISSANKFYLNIIFAVATAGIVILFCFFCTRRIKHFSPIDAIRNGETGERYSRKSIIRLDRPCLPTVLFMAVNDILSSIRKYISMVLIFTLGLLLVIIPINTINTLQSDNLITLFNMADCDHVIIQELLFSPNKGNKEMIRQKLDKIRKILHDNQIEADVFQEIMFRFTVCHGDKKSSSLAFQGTGGVTTDKYPYLDGTPPQNEHEIALSYLTADKIDAGIGDEIDIIMGDETRKYTVTAINQSMNNTGEGIRFYHGDDIDYNLAGGSFGIQILYRDNPDRKTSEERKELLGREYSDKNVYTAGEYISYMIGDVAEQLESVRNMILGIVICINILVAVLMVKSFITREKGEIAVLKAIGFDDRSLILWQSARIGIVLLFSILISTAVSKPLSNLIIEPVFRMMGAYSIEFEIIPLEVYVIYPLTILLSTVLAAAASALQVRKIEASETSNIE